MGEGSARPIVLVGQLDNCMFNEGEEKKNSTIGALSNKIGEWTVNHCLSNGASPLTEKMI